MLRLRRSEPGQFFELNELGWTTRGNSAVRALGCQQAHSGSRSYKTRVQRRCASETHQGGFACTFASSVEDSSTRGGGASRLCSREKSPKKLETSKLASDVLKRWRMGCARLWCDLLCCTVCHEEDRSEEGIGEEV